MVTGATDGIGKAYAFKVCVFSGELDRIETNFSLILNQHWLTDGVRWAERCAGQQDTRKTAPSCRGNP